MTPKEKDVFNYIIEFKKINSFSPTIREIADGVNTKSTTHVKEILERLRERGYIKFIDKKPRTIVVLKFYKED